MSDEPRIYGADTETTAGYVRLLALSDGAYLDSRAPGVVGRREVLVRVRRSDRRILEDTHPDFGKPEVAQDDLPITTFDTDTLFRFLYDEAERVDLTTFWNLGFDFSAIIKPWMNDPPSDPEQRPLYATNAEMLRHAHYANIQRQRRLNELAAKEVLDEAGLSHEELNERQALTAAIDGEDTIQQFDTDQFHVRLVGSKGFSLRPRKRGKKAKGQNLARWFFDTSPWYSSAFGGMKLDTAGRKFLGRGKTDEDLALSREAIGNVYGYYEEHKDDIIRYCVEDCKLTRDLMALTIQGFRTLHLPFPDKPFSRASVSREYFRESGVLNETRDRYQRLRGSPYASLWNKAFRGGVFLQLGVGQWLDPYGLDINSAYPYAMVGFPTLKDAVVVDADDPRFKESFFTFHRVRLRPTPRIPYRSLRDKRKVYGWSEEEVSVCLTGIDVAVLREFGEEFVVEQECGIYCPHPEERPLAYLAEIFDRKSTIKKDYGKDSVEYANVKIFLNGAYGILAQRRPRESEWTNLIYASYVTATCRAQLWRAARETEERGDYITALATDGLMVAGEGARSYWREQASDALGRWSYQSYHEVVAFESGVGFVDDREVKRRGLPALTREALVACEADSWSEMTQRPLKLRSAMIQKRVAQLGVFEDHERTLCPVDAYAQASLSIPKELRSLPLQRYFKKSWRLLLRGQVGTRLTPPRDPAERVRWESMLRRHTPPDDYISTARPYLGKDAASGKTAKGPTPTKVSGARVKRTESPEGSGGVRGERQARRTARVGAQPRAHRGDSQVSDRQKPKPLPEDRSVRAEVPKTQVKQ